MKLERTEEPSSRPTEAPRSLRVVPAADETRRAHATHAAREVAPRKPSSLTVRFGAPIGDEDDDESEP